MLIRPDTARDVLRFGAVAALLPVSSSRSENHSTVALSSRPRALST